MKERIHWMERLLPSPTDNGQNDDGSAQGYVRFSRGLSIILLILVLVPLATVSVLSHYQYQDLLEQEEMDQLVLNLEVAQSTIKTSISELQSVIKFVARDDRYDE
jgi:two-component system NtrC family sensor kinase